MNRAILAVLNIVIAQSALANPPMPPSPPTAGITAPVSVGAPHVCDENLYPVSALQTGFEGSTLLSFRVTVDGSVREPKVARSSGNADIDAASINCASAWRYHPAVLNGSPVETVWRAMVKWQIGVSEPFTTIDREGARCIMSTREGREEMHQEKLHPVVRVHFSNGRVASATLVGSSGNADFDARATACYANLPREMTAMVPFEMDETFVVMLQ